MTIAWIAGASGLIGSKLLPLLLADATVTAVASLGRRAVELTHPKLTQRTVDFAALDAAGLPAPDVALCALGTTINKAGSAAAFRAVDHGAVLAFAKAALAAGARRFVVVTSLGADPNSMVLYNRVKGEVEADLRVLGFASLAIARPSLLLGDRAESRPGERVAVVVSRVLGGLLRPFESRPIEAEVVAKALLAITRDPPSGAAVYPSSRLQTLGGG
jgi:uncharacterized protein YbjT (DUF2867 family)